MANASDAVAVARTHRFVQNGLEPHRIGMPKDAKMDLELDKREASQILAALRNWQEETKSVDLADYYEAYFEEHEPLSSEEIDVLCARITNAASGKAV
jgi:hypothetical protein